MKILRYGTAVISSLDGQLTLTGWWVEREPDDNPWVGQAILDELVKRAQLGAAPPADQNAPTAEELRQMARDGRSRVSVVKLLATEELKRRGHAIPTA